MPKNEFFSHFGTFPGGTRKMPKSAKNGLHGAIFATFWTKKCRKMSPGSCPGLKSPEKSLRERFLGVLYWDFRGDLGRVGESWGAKMSQKIAPGQCPGGQKCKNFPDFCKKSEKNAKFCRFWDPQKRVFLGPTYRSSNVFGILEKVRKKSPEFLSPHPPSEDILTGIGVD